MNDRPGRDLLSFERAASLQACALNPQALPANRITCACLLLRHGSPMQRVLAAQLLPVLRDDKLRSEYDNPAALPFM